MQNKKISIALIVRNEESVLARCLDSVKGADEIIIVDTGSVDKTKEIASLYTNKIFDFQWCDDFAKARNFAKAQCTGDWILSIDADEFLEDDGVDKLKILLEDYYDCVAKVKMFSSGNPFTAPRFFKNVPEIYWVGAIHELPNVATQNIFDVQITYTSSPSHQYDPDRNLRILKKEYLENPSNTRSMYYLAREYCYRNDYTKAIEIFDKYLSLATWLPERADAYFMKALCHWYTKNGGEEARKSILMAININANFKAAILLMGHMSFEHNKIQWDKMAETATNEGVLFERVNYLTF